MRFIAPPPILRLSQLPAVLSAFLLLCFRECWAACFRIFIKLHGLRRIKVHSWSFTTFLLQWEVRPVLIVLLFFWGVLVPIKNSFWAGVVSLVLSSCIIICTFKGLYFQSGIFFGLLTCKGVTKMRLVLSKGIPKVLNILFSLLLLLSRCYPDVALVIIKFKLFQITNALLESVGGL